jgi:hypothetical protein
LTLSAVMLVNNIVVAEEDVEVSDEETTEGAATQAIPTEDAYEYEEANPADDVTTTYLLPGHENKEIPLGKASTFLVNFINNGQDVLNITAMGASIQSPFDLNYYIQNFTTKQTNGAVVTPISQMSLEYQITPDATLEPLEVWLSGWVEFTTESSDIVYRKTFFNETAILTNHDAGIEWSIMASSLFLLGAFCFGVYQLMMSTKKLSKAKRKFAPKKDIVVDRAAIEQSWAAETKVYKQADKPRAMGTKKRAPSKKKD